MLYFVFTEHRNIYLMLLLKCTIKLYLYIQSVTLQTVLIHSSPTKPVCEDLTVKDHLKTESEAVMEVQILFNV